MEKQPLQFIEIVDETGRTSSLAFGGNRDTGKLRVVGGLPHNTEFIPKDKSERDRLVKFLNSLKY